MTSVGNSDITNHRPAKLYNLDVILAVGYRVKSKRGILFRRWATAVLRNYLIKGYSLSSDRAIVTNENYIQLINDANHLKKDFEDIKAIAQRHLITNILIQSNGVKINDICTRNRAFFNILHFSSRYKLVRT